MIKRKLVQGRDTAARCAEIVQEPKNGGPKINAIGAIRELQGQVAYEQERNLNNTLMNEKIIRELQAENERLKTELIALGRNPEFP
jgi:hypothetical protein